MLHNGTDLYSFKKLQLINHLQRHSIMHQTGLGVVEVFNATKFHTNIDHTPTINYKSKCFNTACVLQLYLKILTFTAQIAKLFFITQI